MCYSAQVWADYSKYCRTFGADLDIKQFYDLIYKLQPPLPLKMPRIKIPKAMALSFSNPTTDTEREIRDMIAAFNADEIAKAEAEIFKQRKRVADAERKLLTKSTQKALDDVAIGTRKVKQLLGKLSDLKRTELQPKDARIYPGMYAPVLVIENGRRVVLPMRYQCRPKGKPASYDTKFPGTYNARRDNLDRFWSGEFGTSHGIMVVQRFYENVERIDADGKPYSAVLEFVPENGQDMLVACLWSRWSSPNEPDLLSFAAITDEPPPEVAAAGHDRCIVPIKPENIDAWLAGGTSEAMHALLEDRDRPLYEHRLAA